MSLDRQLLQAIQADIEDQQSALSPLLQSNGVERDEPVEIGGTSRSIADLSGRLSPTKDLADGDIELEDIRDVARMESSGSGIGESNM
jgi:hypothetical protein